VRQDLGLSIVLRCPAALCLAGSSIILFGWVTRQPGLLSVFSEGEPIPAQGALLGVLLSLAALLPVGWRWGRILLAGPAAIIAVLSLAESVLGINLGIDWRFAGAWSGADPAAGRTVTLAAITCVVVATGLILAPAPLGSRRRQIIALVAAATAVIALGSLAERVLDLGAIYGWHYLNRMPITTSGGMMFILLPLWWNRMPPAERDLIPRDPAATLMSSGTALLIVVSVLAGSTGLISMRRGIEDGMRNNLLATVRGLGTVFETAIDDRVKFGRLAAARSDLQAAVAGVTAAPDNNVARAVLQNVTESLIGGDIRGVTVLDNGGQVIATSGRLATHSSFARIVDPVSGTRLVWDERLLIDVNTDLMQGAAKLGRIVVEQELPALDTVLVQAAGLGDSGNGTICGLEPGDPNRMECLPNRTNPLPFNAPVRLDGRLLPIANALMGLTGTVDSFDRGGSRVIAAFEPLPRLGMAIDIKVDTAELFQPVRIRARIAVPVLIMIVIGGSLILRDRIAPLTRQLVESEREARERGEALEESRRELMHKNRVLDVALNNMAQGLVLYDGNGRLRAFNQRYERMMGFVPGFLRAGLSHAAVRKRSAEFGAASVEEGVALLLTMGGEETGRQVVERRLRDGRVIEIVHEPLEEGGGVITFSDVTAARAADDALRAAKEGAEAANRAKSEFLSMMSHEVRTPMNGVLGMVRLLLGTRLAADQQKFAETARSSAEALLAILDDILDFSKLEAGRLVLETVTLDLDAFIEGILAIMGPLARDKNLDLDCERGPDLPRWIETDSTRLRQIILNLLGNAVKFTEQGKVILRLGARPTGPGQITLSVAVEDTGPGITPEVVPSLFSRFTQADSSITRKFGGTGLGLAISKQLAELMGGSISVETVLGRGSIFRVTMPCRVALAPAASPAPAASHQAAPGRRLRILVAEDNPVNLAVVTAMLAPYEHEVETATDGVEALARVEQGGIDLVFMDIQMPRMDGLAATTAIRALAGEASHVPIVALTANAMAGHREEYLAAGMNDYIAKPLRPEDLARVLDRWSGAPADAPRPTQLPAPPAGPAPAVDAGRIAELAAIIPPDGLATMLDAFFADGEKRLAAMSAAVESRDLDALRRAAHDLAGLTANYGLAETEQVARQTLAACRAGDADSAWPLAAATARAFHRAEGPLRHAVGTRLAARGTAA
jgi:signal transduction histidine kinase/ActR/RegA family two-component response regulator